MHRRWLIATAVLLTTACALIAQDRTIRALRVQPATGTLWAAGDGGQAMTSTDAGETWTPLNTSNTAHFHDLSFEGPSAVLIGGKGTAGLPAGLGGGAILRTDDGGETFTPLPADATGWLYGGLFRGDGGLMVGQPLGIAAGGVFRTDSAGRAWSAPTGDRPGPLLGASFSDWQFGYAVGTRRRILAIRQLRELLGQSTPPPGTILNDIAITDDNTGWAVGENGLVLTGRPAAPWTLRTLPMPASLRRLANLQDIAIDGPRIAIAGGLAGVVFTSTDGGATFRLAATGGPVRCVEWFDETRLLAGGDAGRLWISRDAGQTWQQTAGPKDTDVLFISAAGENSLYPALAVHASAGINTAMLYATAPHRTGGDGDYLTVPPGQGLLAAATSAGARATAVLGEFRSALFDRTAGNLSETQLLRRWSRLLDIDAEAELVRRMAGAIRTYRPKVVAVGPPSGERFGRHAENHLISRLARRAVALAGDAGSEQLPAPLLPPHRTQRVFVGLEQNQPFTPPWVKPDLLRGVAYDSGYDALRVPAGRELTVELIAQRAIWLTGQSGLTDRPATFTAYHSEQSPPRQALFTSGLVKKRPHYQSGLSRRQQMLVKGTYLRLADVGGRMATIPRRMLQQAQADPPSNPHLGQLNRLNNAALAADQTLLAWQRTCEHGQIGLAEELRQVFLKIGKTHPLYLQQNVANLAMLFSQEYRWQLALVGPGPVQDMRVIKRATERFARLHPWVDTPAGLMLLARGWAGVNEPEKARNVLATLAGGPFHSAWREAAALELANLDNKPLPGKRNIIPLPLINQPGRLDGRLDEPFWSDLPSRPLSPASPPPRRVPRGLVQLMRSPTALVIAMMLPDQPVRNWAVTVAVDVDRDGWTQLQMQFDTTGQKSAWLNCRFTPRLRLAGKTFLLQSPREAVNGQRTIELALPVDRLGGAVSGGLWRLQIRATPSDIGPDGALWLEAGPDATLQTSVSYPLVKVPPTPINAGP